MSKKIILIVIVIVVISIGIGIYLWKEQSQSLTEFKQTEPEKITYFNEVYGYNLKISKEWGGKYDIVEEGNTTFFVYNVVPSSIAVEGENLLFSVTVYSKNEWEEIEKERKEAEEKGLAPGCCPKVFAEINGTVFVYNISISNPYDSPEIAEEFSKMAGQVQEIIASFSLLR